ncbi:MAG: hypothetical protein R6X34_10400 [Chloroflexota bacterium]
MPQPTTPSEQLAALIPDIHRFAQFVMAEILAYQPDLLIGLAHSGWLRRWSGRRSRTPLSHLPCASTSARRS